MTFVLFYNLVAFPDLYGSDPEGLLSSALAFSEVKVDSSLSRWASVFHKRGFSYCNARKSLPWNNDCIILRKWRLFLKSTRLIRMWYKFSMICCNIKNLLFCEIVLVGPSVVQTKDVLLSYRRVFYCLSQNQSATHTRADTNKRFYRGQNGGLELGHYETKQWQIFYWTVISIIELLLANSFISQKKKKHNSLNFQKQN